MILTGVNWETTLKLLKPDIIYFKGRNGNITTTLESSLAMLSKIENLNIYISPQEILTTLYNDMYILLFGELFVIGTKNKMDTFIQLQVWVDINV